MGKITENKAGIAQSPVFNNVQKTAKQGNIPNCNIKDYVGMFKEITDSDSFLVPISSAAVGQRLVRKTIRTETIGKSDRAFGIISDTERFANENGKTLKLMQAVFIDNGEIKRMKVEYDITELVNAGAKPHEIPTLEFIMDGNGTLIYASRQYDDNIDAYKRKTGYDKGLHRDRVIGKFNISSFMKGEQKQEMNSIFSNAKAGWHVIREINVPFFLSFGLHCKDSNMTNVVVSYMMHDGMLFYGAINNSKQSDREWGRAIAGKAKARRAIRDRAEIARLMSGTKKVGAGASAMPVFAVFASAGSAGARSRPAAPMANAPKPFFGAWKAPTGAAKKGISFSMSYFRAKTAIRIGSALALVPRAALSRSKTGLSASAVCAIPLAALGISMIRSLSVSSMRALFLSPGKTKARAPAAALSAAKKASIAKSRAIGYILGIAASFRKAVEGIDARLRLSANGIMIRVLSYVTFGVRKSIEIRNVSYYPYVERLGSLV